MTLLIVLKLAILQEIPWNDKVYTDFWDLFISQNSHSVDESRVAVFIGLNIKDTSSRHLKIFGRL